MFALREKGSRLLRLYLYPFRTSTRERLNLIKKGDLYQILLAKNFLFRIIIMIRRICVRKRIYNEKKNIYKKEDYRGNIREGELM